MPSDNNPELKPKKKRTNKGYQLTQLEKKQLNNFGVHCEKHFGSDKFWFLSIAVPERHREQTHDILMDTLRRKLKDNSLYVVVWEIKPDKSRATGINWYDASMIIFGGKETALDLLKSTKKKLNKESINFDCWEGEQVRDIIKLTSYLGKHRDNDLIKKRQQFGTWLGMPNSIKRELEGYRGKSVYNATELNLTELRRSFMQAFPDIKVDWDDHYFAFNIPVDRKEEVNQWFGQQMSLTRRKEPDIENGSYPLMIKRMFWEQGMTFSQAEWLYQITFNRSGIDAKHEKQRELEGQRLKQNQEDFDKRYPMQNPTLGKDYSINSDSYRQLNSPD